MSRAPKMNKAERLAWLPDVVVADLKAALDGHLDPSHDFDADPDGREDLVQFFQYLNGLTVDGWPGRKTARALYGLAVAIPRSRRAVERAICSGPWERTGRGRGIRWLSQRPATTRVHLCDGATVRLWHAIADEFATIYRIAVEASGYHPKSVGGYNPRVIGGKDRLSLHAYGIAVDFDPHQNPWGGVRKDGSPSLIRQHITFAEVFEWFGWTWGGRWLKGRGDDMHFERRG